MLDCHAAARPREVLTIEMAVLPVETIDS